MTKQQREKRLEVSRYFGGASHHFFRGFKTFNEEGLEERRLVRPKYRETSSRFSLSIFLSWIKQQDLAIVILYKTFPSLEPLFRGYPRDREGKCPLSGGIPEIEVALGSVCTQVEKKMTVVIVDRS